MADEAGPPQPGEVFSLREEDYRFGRGPLVAHVKRVVKQVQHDGEPWWSIVADVAVGTPISHSDSWNERALFIREQSFPRTRRKPAT